MHDNFIERQEKNEKDEAIKYVKNLIENAKKDGQTEDIFQLEEVLRILNTKKYGLVWESHTEKVEVEMNKNVPIFIQDFKKRIVTNDKLDNFNFLLEGDNLHSLYLLEKTHTNSIDMIYIDPPYNTGKKDFIYNDKYVDNNDEYSHSKWLSFLSIRLELAKKLLKDTGFIFISIDDKEQAQLKLLCDEIFGEQNFVSTLSVENNPKGRKNSSFVSVTHEYCLIYAKSKNKSYFKENVPKESKAMTKDENGVYVHNSGKRVLVGENKFNSIADKFDSEKYYSVYYNKDKDSLIFEKEKNKEDINKDLIKSGYKRYISFNGEFLVYNTYTKQKLEDLYKLNKLDFKNEKIYEKNTSDTIRMKSLLVNKKYKAIIDNEEVVFELDLKTTSAKQSLAKTIGKDKFSFPKNVSFIKHLISLIDDKDITILDFFAGSGTTGEAVQKLNNEDGGKRKYILCTNNENQISEEVTYSRMKNIQQKFPHNLKYFKCDFIEKDKFPDIELEYELLNYIAPLIELEFFVDIDNPKVQIILNYEQLEKIISNDFIDPKSNIFIHPDIFLDDNQKQRLIDLDISIKEIPNYYFGKEMWNR